MFHVSRAAYARIQLNADFVQLQVRLHTNEHFRNAFRASRSRCSARRTGELYLYIIGSLYTEQSGLKSPTLEVTF